MTVPTASRQSVANGVHWQRDRRRTLSKITPRWPSKNFSITSNCPSRKRSSAPFRTLQVVDGAF